MNKIWMIYKFFLDNLNQYIQKEGSAWKQLIDFFTAVLLCSFLLGLGACSSMSTRDKSTAIGAGIGGVAGAVLTGGGVLGTVGGAAVGGVIGNQIGKDK